MRVLNKRAARGFYKDHDYYTQNQATIDQPWGIYSDQEAQHEVKNALYAVAYNLPGGTSKFNDKTGAGSNVYPGSTLQSAFNTNLNTWLSSREQDALAYTYKADSEYEDDAIPYAASQALDSQGNLAPANSLQGYKVFPMSAEEAGTYWRAGIPGMAQRQATGATRTGGMWWLRSAANGVDDNSAYVQAHGELAVETVNNHDYGTRPSANLNLDKVAYTAVAGG